MLPANIILRILQNEPGGLELNEIRSQYLKKLVALNGDYVYAEFDTVFTKLYVNGYLTKKDMLGGYLLSPAGARILKLESHFKVQLKQV